MEEKKEGEKERGGRGDAMRHEPFFPTMEYALIVVEHKTR